MKLSWICKNCKYQNNWHNISLNKFVRKRGYFNAITCDNCGTIFSVLFSKKNSEEMNLQITEEYT